MAINANSEKRIVDLSNSLNVIKGTEPERIGETGFRLQEAGVLHFIKTIPGDQKDELLVKLFEKDARNGWVDDDIDLVRSILRREKTT